MLDRLSRLGNRGATNFAVGKVKTAEEAEAVSKMHTMRREVNDFAVEMAKLDETSFDNNRGTPGSVHGWVNVRGLSYQGGAELDEDKNVKSLFVERNGSWGTTKLEVTENDGRQQIYRTSTTPGDVVTEEWMFSDGTSGSYKVKQYRT